MSRESSQDDEEQRCSQEAQPKDDRGPAQSVVKGVPEPALSRRVSRATGTSDKSLAGSLAAVCVGQCAKAHSELAIQFIANSYGKVADNSHTRHNICANPK
jgi:hypothetical protein